MSFNFLFILTYELFSKAFEKVTVASLMSEHAWYLIDTNSDK